MGAYVYRIEPKAIGELEGRPVYPATFAYKPYWNDSKLNSRLAFQSGVARCQAAWRQVPLEQRREVLIGVGTPELGYEVYRHRRCNGAFVDDSENGLDQAPVAKDWRP